MKDRELEILIEQLESRKDLSLADCEGILNALRYLMPDGSAADDLDRRIGTLDGALHAVGRAYPNWTVDLHGTVGRKGGHWRCTLREGDTADNDAAIGLGNASVPAHAVLAAFLRLTAILKKL